MSVTDSTDNGPLAIKPENLRVVPVADVAIDGTVVSHAAGTDEPELAAAAVATAVVAGVGAGAGAGSEDPTAEI